MVQFKITQKDGITLVVEMIICPKCTKATVKGNFCNQCGQTLR